MVNRQNSPRQNRPRQNSPILQNSPRQNNPGQSIRHTDQKSVALILKEIFEVGNQKFRLNQMDVLH